MRVTRGVMSTLAATAIGAALRLYSPGNGPLARDEALFLFIAGLPTLDEVLQFLRQHESHPPLFYLLVRAWTSVAGASETSAAVIPVVASIALIPLVYRIGSRTFSDVAGVVAAWLVALSPTLVFYSPQVRPYSLFSLVALASCASMWLLVEGARRRVWFAYVASTLIMLLTHHWGWIILAVQGILWASLRVAAGGRFQLPPLRAVGSAWLTIAIGYLPWLAALRHQLAVAGYPPQKVSAVGTAFLLPRTVFGPDVAHAGLILLVIMAVVVVIDRVRTSPSAWGPQALAAVGFVPFICIAIAAAISPHTALLLPQTLSTLVPFAALLIGGGVATLRMWGWHAAASVAVMSGLTLMASDLQARFRQVKSNGRDVARHVAAAARPGDVIVVSPEPLASSFNYYFRLPNRQIDYPSFQRQEIMSFERAFDRASDSVAMSAAVDSLENFHRAGRRVWLISERDWLGDSVADWHVSLPDGINSYEAAVVRTNQLRAELERLYGRQDSAAIATDARRGVEVYRALLFSR